MSLTVDVMTNSSPVEQIGKTLAAGHSYDCVLKENTSVLKPVIIVRTANDLSGFNYMHIASFNRYYFIDDIILLYDDTWEIPGHVDVLETYATQILNNTAVIRRQSNLYNTYLNDPEWKVYAYEERIAMKFKTTPFKKALEYILTTAGA